MRIYLDSCVYQDLKRSGGSELLSLIIESKKDNIYCFSEAHIYDLVRDKTDAKFDDMKFIEQIADENCYYYDKKIQFAYFSPTDYYKRFDWTPTVDAFGDEFSLPLLNLLKLIPLNFKQFVKLDQIPADCPADFITLLEKTSNMYEFCISFLSFSDELTEDQKKFRDFVRYLHNNALSAKIYESLGIKGFDGQKISDKQLFKDTYLDYQAKQSVDKHMNCIFANMYNGLEMLGIVKGKPRKQRMINMINDGKHSYFGAFCDIVVSSDEDFVRKTKFLYDLFDIHTAVLSPDDFLRDLKSSAIRNSVKDCMEAIRLADYGKMSKETNQDGDYLIGVLQARYYGYFNRLVYAPRKDLDNFYFLRQSENWSTGTLAKEIDYVTNRLVDELGPDFDKKTVFNNKEFEGEEWSGRTWVMPRFFIELKYKDGIYLRFGFMHEEARSNAEPEPENKPA